MLWICLNQCSQKQAFKRGAKMSNLYSDFEKRFTGNSFSASWIEVDVKTQEVQVAHKDLNTLQDELQKIQENIETIAQKQLRLANLAQMYEKLN